MSVAVRSLSILLEAEDVVVDECCCFCCILLTEIEIVRMRLIETNPATAKKVLRLSAAQDILFRCTAASCPLPPALYGTFISERERSGADERACRGAESTSGAG